MPEHSKPTVAGTAADPTLIFTELTLGKKTYRLIWDFDAVARAEEETGMALLVGVDFSNVTLVRAEAMLYASMLRMHPDVDRLKDIRPHITPGRNIRRITDALIDCWTKSMGEPEEVEAAENPPAA